MTRSVIFNGTTIVRPGAYSRIDASAFSNILLGGNGTVGIIGDADDGPPRTLQVFSGQAGGIAAAKQLYRSGDIADALSLLADPSNDDRIPSGAQQIVVYKTNAGTHASLTKAPFVFQTRGWGVLMNNTSLALSVGTTSNERVLTASGINSSGLQTQEISPSLGGTGKFTIQYTGAGSAATMDITATSLSTTVTGAAGDNVTISFADYKTLQDVITFLQNRTVYTVSSLISNPSTFDSTYLDAVTAVDIKTTLTTVFARNFDLLDWVNKNSALVFVDTATGYTKGAIGPIAVFTTTPMTGGTRGTSANTDWVNGFTALGTLRINQIVPLASTDATATQGTYTFNSILAALSAHCRLLSSTIGRSEREGWAGGHLTKAQLITASNTTNTSAVVLSGQQVQRFVFSRGVIDYMPEWGFACILAGMRAGAPFNEPLTGKLINANGIKQDASWDPNDPGSDDLILNGLTFARLVLGTGISIVKCITTYTQSENDAFIEESIVQIWKRFSFELRRALEARFTGRPATPLIAALVPQTVDTVAEAFIKDGSISPSLDQNGNVVKPAYYGVGFRLTGDQLSVDVTIQPTPGINFELTTIALVPVTIG